MQGSEPSFLHKSCYNLSQVGDSQGGRIPGRAAPELCLFARDRLTRYREAPGLHPLYGSSCNMCLVALLETSVGLGQVLHGA